MNAKEIQTRMRAMGSEERARVSEWFFKTGPGEYGEGDLFLGLDSPTLRKLAKEYRAANFKILLSLLKSKFHEERLLALLILGLQFLKASDEAKHEIYRFYLANTLYINNWDLVDCSAPHVVGAFLIDKDKVILAKLAKSESLWERRIAIVATHYFIRNYHFDTTFKIAEMLLQDREDLIHKAVGWMLREVGKKHFEAEEAFMRIHYQRMPRTMLRYAIERFPEELRQKFLKGHI
ncbi:MAG: DNA alkylation repair protein [Acidobacteriota bacterium]